MVVFSVTVMSILSLKSDESFGLSSKSVLDMEMETSSISEWATRTCRESAPLL